MAGGTSGNLLDKIRDVFSSLRDGKRRSQIQALTLLSIVRLRSKGEDTNVENIAREGAAILNATRSVLGWKISEDDYSREAIEEALRDLEAMGLIEEIEGRPGRYRVKEDEDDLVDEMYRRVGMLFILRCC